MKSKQEFVRHFDEWLYKEMLLLLHSSHDTDWMVRCSKALPGKVTTTLEKMYDFIAESTSAAGPSTTKPSGGNGQAGTSTASAAPSVTETPKGAGGGSKPTTSSALGGAMRPATS